MSNVIIAGFGGQGILFAGKFLVYGGMLAQKQVSWLPSYGPEMRGGTANCSVILSDAPIGSPIVTHPDILIVMNLPSLDKFEDECAPGANVIIDSSLITRRLVREDIFGHYIPASRLAEENGLIGLANIIMIGKTIRETGVIPYDCAEGAMRKSVPERKKEMFEKNIKALEIGFQLKEGI